MTDRILPFGEGAVLVELEQRIDPGIAARAAAIADRWERLGHGPAVPTYAAVLLRYDPLVLEPDAAASEADGVLGVLGSFAEGRLIEVPTRYDGPDLEEVARLSRLAVKDVVALHTGRDHLAYFVGFMPGFAYCGGMDARIVAPRLSSPRTQVPAGAVAVADGQTSVYPFASAGGWRLIGSTDAVVFDLGRAEPALIRAGDRVRFVAV